MSSSRTPLLRRPSLVVQIIAGVLSGIVLAWLAPEAAHAAGFFGELFISALKAVAPVLVFVLVMAAIANHPQGQPTFIRPILVLYLIGTFAAAVAAVTASFLFPSTLVLAVEGVEAVAPAGIGEVLTSLLLNVFVNPVQALLDANFIGIL